MPACDCCCEIVANYREQRVPTDGTSFVAWINAARNFHEYEGSGQDAYGPETLASDGNWSDVGLGLFPSFLPTAGGGEITISHVWGTKHAIAIPRVGDTLTYVAMSQTVQLETEAKTRTLGEIYPGLTEFGWNAYSTQGQVNDAKDAAINYGKLVHGEVSLCIYNELFGAVGEIEIAVWHELDDDGEPWFVSASSGARGKGEYGSGPPSAYERAELNRPTVNNQSPTFFEPAVVSENGGPQLGLRYFAGYFNEPVKVFGEKVTLYRDGEIVLQAIRPLEEATLEATDADGSYLIVSEVEESTNRQWEGTGIDTRRRWPRPFTQLASFVVDRDGPVIGVSPPQDFFSDAGTEEINRKVRWIAATKPISMPAYTAGRYGTTNDDQSVVRPITSLYGGGSVIGPPGIGWLPGGKPVIVPPATVQHFVDEFRDLAGNEATYIPSGEDVFHPVPPNNRRGARPQLEDVGLQTREYWRARFENEQVRTVLLTWDRKVKADTVNASQVTLTRNGESVGGCEIEQRSDTQWVITLPDEPQGSKEFWLLTYDPAGEVVTDDIVTETYPAAEAFPPAENSKYKTVYVDASTGTRYSKSPSGYVAIDGGPPLDADGVAFDPEPCVLASRTAWLMSSFEGWLEPEDTASRRVLVGTRPSILSELTDPPDDDGTVTISTGTCGILDWGTHAKSVAPDAYTPMVPPPNDPPGDCSYWGLQTTIHPCSPREVTVCACPRSAQPHSSVIVTGEDIMTIALSLVWKSTDGTEGGGPPAGWPKEDFADWGEVDVTQSFNGIDLPQNIWAAELPELGPVQTSDLLADFTTTLLGGAVFVEAFRFVTEYAGRKTAYLNELEFEVTSRYLVKTEIDPTELGQEVYGENPEDRYNMRRVYDRFAISKDQEAALADGDAVYVRFKTTQDGDYWWKLQKD